MNTIETREFIDRVKKGVSKEYVKELVDSYLLSDTPANTLNAFDNIVTDNSLAGPSNRQQAVALLKDITMLYVKNGGTPAGFTTMINRENKRTTFDANTINMSNKKVERTNKFSISVTAANLFEALTKIIEHAKAQGYVYDIDIPSMQSAETGVIDTINIYCSNDNLEETIAFINSFTDEIRALFAKNPRNTMHYSDQITYDTFNVAAGKWSMDVFGELIVRAIDTVISEAVEHADIAVTMADADYYNNETIMTKSYLYMKDLFDRSNVDFYELVTQFIKNTLIEMEIDINNVFMSKATVKSLYMKSHLANQLTSPSGFVASSKIKTKPVNITFEAPAQEVTEQKTGILGEDDIPDLPAGWVPPLAPAPEQHVSTEPVKEVEQAVQTQEVGGETKEESSIASPEAAQAATAKEPEEMLRGPEMMLVPEMLERHHDDNDMANLYNSFLNVKHSEAQIADKTMKLNQIWPDLTYADFVAFRQFDRKEDFITNNFIQLWVDTKQQGLVPSISSNELYNRTQEQPVQPVPAEGKLEQSTVPTDPFAQSIPSVAPPMTLDPTTLVTHQPTQGVPPVAPGVPAEQAPVATDPMVQGVPPVTQGVPAEPAPVATDLMVQGMPPVTPGVATEPLAQGIIPPVPSMATEPTVPTYPDVPDPQLMQTLEKVGLADQLPDQTEGAALQATGMYAAPQVEVKPLEEQPLTQGEAQAMMNVGGNPAMGMDLQKYAFIPNAQVVLTQPVLDVDGSSITLYQYLEKYNVLGLIPADATIVTPNGTYNTYEFITNSLAPYVTTNGAIGVEEYLELFNATMSVGKEKKKSLFGKFLGGK